MTETKKRRGRPRKNPEPEVQEEVQEEVTPVEDTGALEQELAGIPEADSLVQSAQLAALEAQVKLLTQALFAERQANAAPQENPEDTPSIGLVRTGGALLSAHLTDAYGRKRHFQWPRVGHKNYVTPAQLSELKDMPGGQKFFDKGWLAIEGEEHLTRMDTKAFIDAMEIHEVDDKIQSIEDTTALLQIMNYIEKERIITEEDGKPLVDSEGWPQAKVRRLSHKMRLLAESVANRIHELTGIRYSLTDG